MKKMKSLRFNALVLAAFAALLFVGCQSVSLDPAGPYKGDVALYQADLAIKQAYTLTDAFLRYEQTNRATVSEDTRKLANNLRDEVPGILADAVAVRDAYAAIGSAESKDRLMVSILTLQKIIERVSAHLPQPKTS
jgi:hypothetical protein